MSTATTVHAEDVMPVRSRINWGAIFAGAAMAFATYLVLTLLGSAIGLSIRDQVQPENLGIGAAVWAVITMIVALFVGGCVTTQCTVGENRMEAVIHGIIMWGVMFAAMVWLVAVGVRSGFNALVGMSTISQTTGVHNPTIQDWEAAARRANVPQAQIDQWRAQINDAPHAAARAANDPRTPEVATAAAWWSLGGVLLSMLSAVLGALSGAGPVLYLLRLPQANRVMVTRQVSTSNP